MKLNDPLLSESNILEFKSCSNGRLPQSVLDTIVAFSNTYGGRIICGRKDDGQSANLTSKDLDKLQLQVIDICTQAFNIKIIPQINIQDGQLIVEIEEAAITNKPVFIAKRGLITGTYLRRGSSNIKATSEDIKRLIAHAEGGAETRILTGLNYNQYFDFQQIAQYQQQLNLDNFSIEEILFKTRAIDKEGNVTLFGLLAFSKENSLQELTKPTVCVAVTQYRGTDKINPNNLNETYIEKQEFTGNIVNQFNQVLNYLTAHLSSHSEVDNVSGLRHPQPIIPVQALRELIANSLIHRDYATYGSANMIDIYEDRLEIINLGISLVDINKLESDPPMTRNPLVVKLFSTLGIVEQQARGIRLVQDNLKKFNLPPAKFENLHSHFKVTIFIKSFLKRHQEIVSKFSNYDLNEQQLTSIIHLYLKAKSGLSTAMSNADYRHQNNMHKTNDHLKARRDLKALVDLNILIKQGTNKTTKYSLNPKYLEK